MEFPEPAAGSPQAAAEELIELFDFLGDWNERHQQVIEMGGKLPPMPAELKIEPNRVRGCQSTVHLFAMRNVRGPKTASISSPTAMPTSSAG